MRVVLVVCPSYQGATLLALLLNNHSRVSALGDTLPLRATDPVCACGRRVSECDFWQSVADGLDTSRFADLPTWLPVMPWPLSHRHFEGSLVRVSRNPRLNRTVGRLAGRLADLGAPAAWRLRSQPVDEFVQTYLDFYGLVTDLQGTSTFVDGYKSWRKAALLARSLPSDADVRIVHLMRDPRGFASSRRRHDGADDLRESGWLWSDLHRRMESLREAAPYRLLRYEDLCAQPEAEMQSLCEFMSLEPEPVVGPVKYPHKHHMVGNQMLRTFSGAVTLDERWRTELSPAEQGQVLACAGDLAARFGYGAEREPVAQAQPA